MSSVRLPRRTADPRPLDRPDLGDDRAARLQEHHQPRPRPRRPVERPATRSPSLGALRVRGHRGHGRRPADARLRRRAGLGRRRARRSASGAATSPPCPPTAADLFVANSGTTMRFLTAMVALGHGTYRLDGIPRMRERPIRDLLDALDQLGVGADQRGGQRLPAGVDPRRRLARRARPHPRRRVEPVPQRACSWPPRSRRARRRSRSRAAWSPGRTSR